MNMFERYQLWERRLLGISAKTQQRADKMIAIACIVVVVFSLIRFGIGIYARL